MYDYADIYQFLAQKLGVDEATLTPDDSLFDDLGVDGDDFFELEQAFARRFAVDMSDYRWHFHHNSEGWLTSPGVLFFQRPYDRIAVTPRLLVESANAGKWLVEYPPHKGPLHRFHLVAVSFVLLILLLWVFPATIMQLIKLFGRLVHTGR
jgi:acyl carrier protein